MTSVLATVLPLSLGAAISPTVLTVQVLLLSSGRDPRARAGWFVVGSGAVLAGAIAVFATLARGVSLRADNPATVEVVVKLVAAAALLALGVRALVHTPQKHRPAVSQSLPNTAYLGVGAGLMLTNLSTLVLIIPAVHDTINAHAALPGRIALLAAIWLIALLPAWGPLALVLAGGRRADPVLQALHGFVSQHGKWINAGIAFLFAALLTYSALS